MFGLRVATEYTPRAKKCQPAQRTTGVDSSNSIQRMSSLVAASSTRPPIFQRPFGVGNSPCFCAVNP